jgi:uncharacterized OB-fold protein
MEHKLIYMDYNEALKQDRLLGLKCRACGAIIVPPKMVCRSCNSNDLEVIELKGNGKIRTYTTVNVAAEGREEEVPYTIVMVELAEGPWIMGNLEGIDPGELSMDIIGKPVKMSHRVFDGDKYSAGEGACPVFRLDE